MSPLGCVNAVRDVLANTFNVCPFKVVSLFLVGHEV